MNEIERSIIKTYRKDIWRKFTRAINDYCLIEDNDKIGVCISGGKDSFLLAKCFQELKKHGKNNFELEFITINPGFNNHYLELLKENAKNLDIPLNIYDVNIFDVVNKLKHKSNCYICAKMRRGHLYDKAISLGCNKIALGHHLDDVIETTFLNMFYNGKYEAMRPILDSDNFKNIKLIRPLYYINESDIQNWVKHNDLNFEECNCGFIKEKSKRIYLKDIINQLRSDNKFFDANMIKALENVNIDNTNGYIKDNVKHKNY